jgi:heme exporter protein B
MGFLSTALRIAEKDLKTEIRRTYEILSISGVVSATIWVILFFASVLVFTTSFTREADRGTFSGLKTLPCDPLSILFGKTLYAIVMLFIVAIVSISFSIIFLNLGFSEGYFDFIILTFFGTVCLSITGSFISSLLIFSEEKTLLMSFLFFPISTPVLLPSVIATEKIISGLRIMDVISEVKLLFAFLLSITIVSTLTFKFVFEE